MDPDIVEYRKSLQSLQEKMQAEYDRAVLALSGGALGISMTFTREFIGQDRIECSALLLIAWMCWAVSICSILASFFTSAKAMEVAIRQTDENTLYAEPVGGFFDMGTKVLNIFGGLFFFLGVLSMTLFVGIALK